MLRACLLLTVLCLVVSMMLGGCPDTTPPSPEEEPVVPDTPVTPTVPTVHPAVVTPPVTTHPVTPVTPPTPTPVIPTPPPEPVLVLKIIKPINPPVQNLEWVLADDAEIAYFWTQLYDCPDPKPGPDCDVWIPNGQDILVAEYYGMGGIDWVHTHHIFVRFGPKYWPRNVTEVKLRLFCLSNSSDFFSGGLGVFLLEEDWPLPPADPATWQMYCEEDLPADNCLLDPMFAESTEAGEWYEVDLTYAFEIWAQHPEASHIVVKLQNGSWFGDNEFAGPTYADPGQRPSLQLNYLPLELKLPLPGDNGEAWLVTTEAGGGDCASNYIDTAHTGTNWHSLDFTCASTTDGKKVVSDPNIPVPILAAADGIVTFVGNDPSSPNGNCVFVNHSSHDPNNPTAGVSTRYLHLATGSICVKPGDCVAQGCKLGIMGNTGQSTGIHLHFGVRYDDDGSKDIPQLANGVTLEGRPIGDFRIECEKGVRTTYYISSNTQK